MSSKTPSPSKKPRPNPKVIIYALIALGCLVLMYLVHWAFIIPAAILLWLNWKELMGKK
ncbi:MAG: hypothetical protein Q7S74_01805 [Nanoarchaeota archaeon]|nr:hypothetical protein [Nanoarchaeota archaeon]